MILNINNQDVRVTVKTHPDGWLRVTVFDDSMSPVTTHSIPHLPTKHQAFRVNGNRYAQPNRIQS